MLRVVSFTDSIADCSEKQLRSGIARADSGLRSLLTRLSRIDVLVIDGWAMAPMREAERRDSWEIRKDRYQTRSTILTPNCR